MFRSGIRNDLWWYGRHGLREPFTKTNKEGKESLNQNHIPFACGCSEVADSIGYSFLSVGARLRA